MENLIEITINDDKHTIEKIQNNVLGYPAGDALFYIDYRIKTNVWIKLSQIASMLSGGFYRRVDVPNCLYMIIKYQMYPITRVLSRNNRGAVEVYFATCDNLMCGRHNAGKKRICEYIKARGNIIISIYDKQIGEIDTNLRPDAVFEATKINILGCKLRFVNFSKLVYFCAKKLDVNGGLFIIMIHYQIHHQTM